MNFLIIYLILFVEGLVSVSLQILIMRQLIPFVGNSVVTVSIVISIFLMSLSMGYYFGGKIKGNYKKRLKINFLISAVIVSLGFSYFMVELFFNNSFVDSLIINLILFLFIFLFTPIFFLGQTIPIITNFIKKEKISEITGGALAINTVGSVLGSLLTSIVFLYFFGVGLTVMLNVVLLLILSIVVSGKKLIDNFFLTLTIGIIIIVTFNINIVKENNRFIKTNQYTNYEIKDNSNFLNPVNKELILNNSNASLNLNNSRGYEYGEYIKNYLFNFIGLKNKDILVLGAGGFTLSLPDYHLYNNFKYIDNDPDIKYIAENYFLKNKIGGRFKLTDGRVYLNKSKKNNYDVIVLDVFSNRRSIPWHFITKEFMDLLSEKTDHSGYIVINTIMKKDFNSEFSKRMHNTITKSLNNCIVNPLIQNDSEYINVVYICKNEKSVNVLYRDSFDKFSLDELIKK